MSKFKYKNITDQDHSIMGFGVVKAGATIDSDWPIQNPNFELMEKETFKKRSKN